jgi:hypothetical protein
VAGKDTASSDATLTVTPGDPSPLQPYIGVNFVGGGGGGRGGTLTPFDVAGAIPQENWNNVTGFEREDVALHDVAGASTPVRLSYAATQSWYSGTLLSGDADGVLLQGYVNAQNAPEPLTFTFNGVPAGNYQVLVYSAGFQFQATYEQAYSATGAATSPTLRVKAQTGLEYIQSPGLKRMASTNPNQRDHGNYVQIENVSPDASGAITVSVTPESLTPGNNHLPAVNAIQLVRVVAVTARPSLSAASVQGTSFTLSWPASAAGFTLESSASLGAGANWAPVSGVANPLTGAGTANISTADSSRFYRLRQ